MRSWGWPEIAAQVHFTASRPSGAQGWGWPEIGAQVHSVSDATAIPSCWGWPEIAAQVHCPTEFAGAFGRWGWPEIAAQVHYTGPKLLIFQQIRPVHTLKKAESGRELAQVLAVFFHEKLPSFQTDDLSH